jgi:phage baseplate assembly protein W
MRNGFTPSFPFQIDREDSDYILIDKTPDLVRQNLTNIILTTPGERIMDPEFGVGIKRFLFENRTSAVTSTIKNIINGQVKKYMPFVTIDNVVFSSDKENPNFLGIAILYTIVPTSTRDLIRLNFDLLSQTLLR